MPPRNFICPASGEPCDKGGCTRARCVDDWSPTPVKSEPGPLPITAQYIREAYEVLRDNHISVARLNKEQRETVWRHPDLMAEVKRRRQWWQRFLAT